jgi:coenzyme F420-reducing hydrogenase delta subunit
MLRFSREVFGFHPHTFKFIIHYNSNIRRYTVVSELLTEIMIKLQKIEANKLNPAEEGNKFHRSVGTYYQTIIRYLSSENRNFKDVLYRIDAMTTELFAYYKMEL